MALRKSFLAIALWSLGAALAHAAPVVVEGPENWVPFPGFDSTEMELINEDGNQRGINPDIVRTPQAAAALAPYSFLDVRKLNVDVANIRYSFHGQMITVHLKFAMYMKNKSGVAINLNKTMNAEAHLQIDSDGTIENLDIQLLSYNNSFGGLATDLAGTLNALTQPSTVADARKIPLETTVKDAVNPALQAYFSNPKHFATLWGMIPPVPAQPLP